MRLKSDYIQCQEMRKSLPDALEWNKFLEIWTPDDLILVTRLQVKDKLQAILFERQKKNFHKF